MDTTKFPELPPRHSWWFKGNDEITIQAERTEYSPTCTEHVIYANKRYGDQWKVAVWKKNPGRWDECGFADTAEEAANWMNTMLLLGMADYTLLEDKNG